MPQRFSFRQIPADSAGSGSPVFCPKPKRRTYSYMFCAPTWEPDQNGADVARFLQHLCIVIVP